MNYIQSGSKEFKQAKLAFLIAGLVTFATIYTVQPTLPLFVEDFHISPTLSSLSLSVTTGLLSVSMLVAATLSDRFGMKKIMVISMFATSFLGLVTSLSPNFLTLLLIRILLGILVAGVPSLAMAFIGKEFSPKDSIQIMGFYISGSSIGGMSGRLLTGLITDLAGWRVAFAVLGILSLILSIFFLRTLPKTSTQKERSNMGWAAIWNSYKTHMMNRKVNYLFILGFILMGSFVSMYNYIGFLLIKPPYNISHTILGFIFMVYLFGTFSSIFMGKKAKQYGASRILKLSIILTITGAWITLLSNIFLIILGLCIFTFGFFASHSIASSLVAERAKVHKAQASSLYLLFYYIGSSFIGTLSGNLWEYFSWYGVIASISILLLAGLVLVFVFGSINVNSERNRGII